MNITAAAPIPAPPPEAPKPAPLRLGDAPDRARCLAQQLVERPSRRPARWRRIRLPSRQRPSAASVACRRRARRHPVRRSDLPDRKNKVNRKIAPQ
jgi:hypothetical protein